MSTKTYLTTLRLIVSMLLMFTLGTTTAWGQTGTDRSGIFYFANGGSGKTTPDDPAITSISDPDDYFYLVPADNPRQDNKRDAWYSSNYSTANGNPEKPYLTTYKTKKDAATVPTDVTERPHNSVWIVKFASTDSGTDYYYLIHAATGKYVVYEPPYSNNWNRKSVHLLKTDRPGDNAKFAITTHQITINSQNYDTYNFRPESRGTGDNDNKYLNAANANYNFYYSSESKADGDANYFQGLVGLWKDVGGGSDWKPEKTLLGRPTISVNVESGTFSITPFVTPDFPLPSDYSIRYTIGDGNQDPPKATTESTAEYTYTGYAYTGAVRIGNFKNVKAVIVGHGMVLSEVANVDVKCDFPSLTSYDETTNSVVFKTATTGATIYYTSTTDGSDPADPTTSNNSGYGSSPLTINDVNGTTKFKAIAVKEGLVNSDVFSQIMVVPQTITLSSSSFAYTGLEIEPTVSINGGDIPDTEYEVSYNNTNINAGTATATVTNKSGGNYYVIGGSVNFEITKVPLTITANDHTITYGDEPTNGGVTYLGFVNNEGESGLTGTLVYAYNYSQYGNVGTYADAITPSGLTSDNYDITFNSGTLTVTQKEVGLTWGTTGLTYSGVSQVPTVTAAGTVNDDVINVTVTGGKTAVGSGYTATATELTGTKADNYKLPAANTKEFSIGKAPLTVTANDLTITYGENPADAEAGVTYSGFVNGETESVLTGTPKYYFNYAQFDNVGDNYTITPYDLAATNYVITFVPGTLTVTQKAVELSWGTTELTYSGVNQVPTATATETVNGDEIGVTVTGGQTNIGSDYTATATELTGTKAGNYKLPTANTTKFSIGKASLTVTAKDHTITYGDAPANGGVTYSGFVNNESESVLTGPLGYDYSYARYGDVGDEYTITPKGLTSTNYNITFENGTLTVNPKEVRIKWKNTALTYDGTSKVPTAEITSRDDDIVNDDAVDDIVTVTASAKEGSELTDGVAINPGYYKATAYFTINGAKTGNYKPTPSSLTFSISSKSIGDGNEPAEGIDISLTQVGDDVEVTYVKDGGTTLVLDEDYTVATETQGFDYYIIVTGKGKYGGSARKLFVKPEFFKPIGASEYAAVYRASSDLTNPTGITPYIVKKVNPSMGTINIASVGYLPKDVPVLMLADTDISGFEASSKPDNVTAITAQTENSNLLKVAPEGGVSVKDAQVYMFYKGEFVLTKEGTISEGKFYLYNPNYKANLEEEEEGGGAGARSVLRFVVGGETGIVDVEKSEDSRTASENDAWYLLDGRRLSGKPNKQGLYIWNGRKTVIKKK